MPKTPKEHPYTKAEIQILGLLGAAKGNLSQDPKLLRRIERGLATRLPKVDALQAGWLEAIKHCVRTIERDPDLSSFGGEERKFLYVNFSISQ